MSDKTITLSAAEFEVLALLAIDHSACEREDVMGAILKRTGHNLLNDTEIVALDRKIEMAATASRISRCTRDPACVKFNHHRGGCYRPNRGDEFVPSHPLARVLMGKPAKRGAR